MRPAECSGGSNGKCFLFQQSDRTPGRTNEFSLANATMQVDNLAVGAGKLVVMGRVDQRMGIVTIISRDSGTVLDSFMCLSPSISPDGEKLVYLSPSAGVGHQYQYMGYDLTQDAMFNRLAGATSAGRADVGVPLYPRAAGKAPQSGGESRRVRGSRLIWLDSNRLAFADIGRGSVRLVLANLAAGLYKATTTVGELDVRTAMCEGAADADAERVWISDIFETSQPPQPWAGIQGSELLVTLESRGACIADGREQIKLSLR
jgi:hypothetical protein